MLSFIIGCSFQNRPDFDSLTFAWNQSSTLFNFIAQCKHEFSKSNPYFPIKLWASKIVP